MAKQASTHGVTINKGRDLNSNHHINACCGNANLLYPTGRATSTTSMASNASGSRRFEGAYWGSIHIPNTDKVSVVKKIELIKESCVYFFVCYFIFTHFIALLARLKTNKGIISVGPGLFATPITFNKS